MQEYPNIPKQPPSVDFIDIRMPDYHHSFEQDLCRFEPEEGKYEPRGQLSIVAKHGILPPPRQVPAAVSSMKFWESILPNAMDKLRDSTQTPEPKALAGSDSSIRFASTWDEVIGKLEKAQLRYDGTKQGLLDRLKYRSRKVMDYTDGVHRIVKVVPDTDIVSPVLAAVNVLLDACKTATSVRKKIKASFEDENFLRMFSNIEVFLSVFPEDQNIVNASIKLCHSLFRAIEEGIAFFIKHRIERGALVVIQGSGYQNLLLEQLDQVQKDSEELIHQAKVSDITSTRETLKAIFEGNGEIKFLQHYAIHRNETVIENLRHVAQEQADLRNLMMKLLDEGEERDKRYKEAQQRLLEENAELRTQLLDWRSPPAPQIPGPGFLPPQQYLLPGPSPPYANGWWVSSSQPQFPMAPVHPLQLQATIPHIPLPQSNERASGSTPAEVLRAMSFSTIDDDIQTVLSMEYSISSSSRHRARQIAGTTKFRNWMLSTSSSRRLFILGDLRPDTPHYISALSVFCATLSQAFINRERYVPLIFFCGQHLYREEESDPSVLEGVAPGGRQMIQSLVSQLLRQFPRLSVPWALEQNLLACCDIKGAASGSLDELCRMFRQIVRSIPSDRTIICLIDGISYFETDELQEEMLVVASLILDISRRHEALQRGGLPPEGCAVKVLVTSPFSTSELHSMFRSDDEGEDEYSSILDMAEMPMVGYETGLLQYESRMHDSGLEEETDDQD